MRRNYGVDLVKIISMFFVVALHILGFGGILESTQKFSINNGIGNYIYVLAMCAVDVFVITTGFVYAEKKYKFKNLIYLWFIVFFYSVIIAFVFYFLQYPVDKIDLYKSFFPLLTKQYWFFNEYFALFLFIPFLNIIGDNKRKLQYSIIISILVISIITYFLRSDIFYLGDSYGLVWFLILYLIGVYIKKYSVNNDTHIKNLICYFIMSIIMLVVSFVTQYIALKYFNKNVIVGAKAISYNSIWVVLEAVFLFLFFKNLKIKNNILIKIISFISPLVFSVYLISENGLFRKHIIIDKFAFISDFSIIMFFFSLIGIILVIFTFCLFIDYIRLKIFNLLKIKKVSIVAENKLKIFYNKIVIIMERIIK